MIPIYSHIIYSLSPTAQKVTAAQDLAWKFSNLTDQRFDVGDDPCTDDASLGGFRV